MNLLNSVHFVHHLSIIREVLQQEGCNIVESDQILRIAQLQSSGISDSEVDHLGWSAVGVVDEVCDNSTDVDTVNHMILLLKKTDLGQ